MNAVDPKDCHEMLHGSVSRQMSSETKRTDWKSCWLSVLSVRSGPSALSFSFDGFVHLLVDAISLINRRWLSVHPLNRSGVSIGKALRDRRSFDCFLTMLQVISDTFKGHDTNQIDAQWLVIVSEGEDTRTSVFLFTSLQLNIQMERERESIFLQQTCRLDSLERSNMRVISGISSRSLSLVANCKFAEIIEDSEEIQMSIAGLTVSTILTTQADLISGERSYRLIEKSRRDSPPVGIGERSVDNTNRVTFCPMLISSCTRSTLIWIFFKMESDQIRSSFAEGKIMIEALLLIFCWGNIFFFSEERSTQISFSLSLEKGSNENKTFSFFLDALRHPSDSRMINDVGQRYDPAVTHFSRGGQRLSLMKMTLAKPWIRSLILIGFLL